MEVSCNYIFSKSNVPPKIFYTAGCEAKGDGLQVKSVSGVHYTGLSDEDVDELFFYDTPLNSFPIGIHKFFPNLKSLSINRTGLKELSLNDFDGLEHLEIVDLAHNELTSLPSNLLKNLRRLEFIDFSHNQLQYVSPKMFSHQHSKLLKKVDFSSNISINVRFPRDCSTLQELIAAIESSCDTPIVKLEEKVNSKLVDRFRNLWTTGNFSDFTVEVDGKEFKVHKTVLGVQSSVLSAVFNTDMEEKKSKRMKIVDYSSEAVEEFLKYFYTGTISEVHAMEMFALAAKYDVPELKDLTEKVVAGNVDQDNAAEVFKFGSLHGSEIIKTAAFKEIKFVLKDFNLPDELIGKPETLCKMIKMKGICDEKMEELKDFYKKAVDTL